MTNTLGAIRGLLRVSTFTFLIALLFLAAPSQAALIGTVPTTNGMTVFPGLTSDTPGTLLATLVSPYSFVTTAGTTSGTLTTAVYREAGGTLDFYYQVSNSANSATAIARMTATNFFGFTTNLGYRVDGLALPDNVFINGTVPPVTGDKDGPGQVVGFSFQPPDAAKILPGLTSNVLVISTNATNYVAGNAAIIDGGTQTVAAFQPAGAPDVIPEPATLGLIGAGLVAVALRRKFSA
jgi:hypothetical protein